ncbi:hypothetical protein QAD02_003178 [Eretmocerus hayati]|uniref:Uncharacterized protein n=1 Tax=Eretmocerus hayati TaxID=131215 RepID=A0ACC2NKX8_9HYME|nr:hypothetical protein QAD02_003178 [Eretmocerus hayati]
MCPQNVNNTPDNFPALDRTSTMDVPPSSHVEQTPLNTSATPLRTQPLPAQKRAHESTSSSDGLSDGVFAVDDPSRRLISAAYTEQRKNIEAASFSKHVVKKSRNENAKPVNSTLPVTPTPSRAKLSEEKYAEFVTRSKGCDNFKGLIAEYTDDIDDLISMVGSSYETADKHGKSSLTRLKKKLIKLQKPDIPIGEKSAELDKSSTSTLNSTHSVESRDRALRSHPISSI